MAGRSNIGGQSKTDQSAVAAVEKQRQALELRKAGVGFGDIAERLGYADASGAYRAVKTALKKTLQEPADEVRRIELERLDRMLLGLWPKATKGDTWAVDRVLRIMERRAGLLGLDAPKRVENTGKDGGPIRLETEPRHDFSALSPEEQFALDQMLAKVESGGGDR